MSWPKRDMFAVTVDGQVLINILALYENDPPPLALRRGMFVGVVVTGKERQMLSEHLYDAMSALAASMAGKRRRKRAAGGRA
jgi:hypothetical protein